ncbi:MAG: HRDC domain-containing protein [Pirellulaceae bacterium]|nr:HRDC domain-containing protein [Pirellulaceae bacterium]
MPFKFILIPLRHSEDAERELNAFLRGHRVLHVDRRCIESDGATFWSFCVEYVDVPAAAGQPGRPAEQRSRVDYREVLNAEDFAVFASLRELRKELSQAENIPAYQVFNDLHLAEMVRKNTSSKSDLLALPNVGPARVEKYGQRFLDRLRELRQPRERQDETDGKSV